ncbi:hypothetical protein E8A74_34720 [Polyangium fumosum]|uniref:Sulfatase-modifying factor enzyme-like domain-containing protein n=2 Tax=Polyangium fumosum TaxID=889272 RepID=A0A4U1J0E6_9BACT|nr:hypothetical protein E8A74_34720 [Polyangium fumosum]
MSRRGGSLVLRGTMKPSVFFHSPRALGLAAVALLAATLPAPSEAEAKGKKCPEGMVSVAGKYCIDTYEAHVVEIVGKNKTKGHSPYQSVAGLRVKAVSKKGKAPQAYISRNEAEEACKNAGKRLCVDDEWIGACKGKKPTTFPYGSDRVSGNCNDGGYSSFNALYGVAGGPPPQEAYTFANMNDERLNQMKGTLAKSGAYKKCRSSYGAFDMVGNLHEWTASKTGTFRGGYYLDTHQNGDGCDYKTTAHNARYHDYSTGFRCCQ